MVKCLLITHPGIEDISALEVKEIIKKKCETKQSIAIFETKDYKDIIKIAYKAQSITKILVLLDKIKLKQLKDVNKLKINLKEWINANTSFKIKCRRKGKHDFKSKEIEEEVGGLIIDKYKLKVNLTNPNLIIYAYVYDDNLYLGIDITGIDLSKRSYKIFHHPNSLKGTIAYTLVRIAGYKHSKKMIDPFCNNGTIILEAGLFASNFSVRYFDKERFAFKNLKPFSNIDFDELFKEIDSKIKKQKLNLTGSESLLRHVISCKKNAKIAGIDKLIEFRRYDIEWLDTKFNKEEIDSIVTKIIEPNRLLNEKKLEKIYQEFFYHAEFVLKKKGKVIIMCKNKELIIKKAKEYNLKTNINREITIGDQKNYILEIKK